MPCIDLVFASGITAKVKITVHDLRKMNNWIRNIYLKRLVTAS